MKNRWGRDVVCNKLLLLHIRPSSLLPLRFHLNLTEDQLHGLVDNMVEQSIHRWALHWSNKELMYFWGVSIRIYLCFVSASPPSSMTTFNTLLMGSCESGAHEVPTLDGENKIYAFNIIYWLLSFMNYFICSSNKHRWIINMWAQRLPLCQDHPQLTVWRIPKNTTSYKNKEEEDSTVTTHDRHSVWVCITPTGTE